MKTLNLMVLFVLAMLPMLLFAQPQGASGSWDLIFEDNFNGSSLDQSKWSYNYPWGSGHTHNHEAWCVAEQVSVQNGHLRITATDQKHPDSEEGYDWTSGLITSSGKFHMDEGFIEGRFRMPSTLGTWPAFWTLGDGWPPEIDILEVPHERDKYYWNYHYSDASGNHASFGGSRTGPDLSAGWHTYGVEWDVDENYIRFYFDGQQVASYTNRSEISQAVDQYILINLAVGGWGGTPASGPWPTYFDCDWVRAWEKGSGGGSGGGAGTYQLRNRATGLYLDGMGRTSNGAAAAQYANTSHPNAQWEMIDAGSSQGTFYYFQNVGTGMKLDGYGRTTNGDDVAQYANSTTHVNAQWIVEQYDGSYYRIENRGTGLYLDGMGRTGNGDAVGQWANTTSQNAQWELISMNSAQTEQNSIAEKGNTINVYPNPATENIHISLSAGFEGGKIAIYNNVGQLVESKENIEAGTQTFDLSNFNKGVYIVKVSNSNGTDVLTKKFSKE